MADDINWGWSASNDVHDLKKVVAELTARVKKLEEYVEILSKPHWHPPHQCD